MFVALFKLTHEINYFSWNTDTMENTGIFKKNEKEEKKENMKFVGMTVVKWTIVLGVWLIASLKM